MKRNIPISLPVTGEEEWQATREPLMTGWLTSGPKVREFEQLFAQRHQVKHALAVTSATTALHLALVALGVGPETKSSCPLSPGCQRLMWWNIAGPRSSLST
jgi:perosamine synthetase